MRKWTTMLAILSLAGTTAMAANIDQGTRELEIGGGVNFDTIADTQFDLNVGYGYFVRDQWEVIGRVGVSDNDLITTWTVGVATEYNFDPGGEIIPYIGIGIAGAGTDLDQGSNDSGAVFNADLGTKFFMRDDVAPFIALRYNIATEDIYREQGGVPSDDEILITWGIRFFFD